MAGQAVARFGITAITQANPCSVTVDDDHGFADGDMVRLTDLNSKMPTLRGMDQIDTKRFKVVVTGETTFTLQDPSSSDDIDSTDYTPYVTGGSCNKIATLFDYEAE